MLVDLPRLIVVRQRRVHKDLAGAAADKAFMKTLADEPRKALLEVLRQGEALGADHDLPPLLVDSAADTVFGAFEAYLACIERGMTDRVVAPLPEPQAKKKAAASALRQRVYPNGTSFLSLGMSLQYNAMVSVIDTLREDEECSAAVEELGAGFFVEHMEAHLAPYGRAVKTTDNRDLEAVSTAFHEAVVRLVVKVSAHHEGDKAIHERLFNAYETELEKQRGDERDRLRKRKKQAEKAAKDAKEEPKKG